MALILQKQMHNIITILLFTLIIQAQSHEFSKQLSPNSLGLKKQKLTHLHFYYHDIRSTTPDIVQVAEAATTNTSKTGFGSVSVLDGPLTVGPELTSKIVGRAQGMVASADLNDFGFLFVINYIFTDDKYNGSTLSVLGRNQVLLPVRELPIVGGTGIFRFARGYMLTNTQFFNVSTGDGAFEYNVYVFHY
ncbi:putative dirigent protein [Helianthus annuus]|nr:putative dirigent protein [Helianthus annuus]